MHRHAQHVLVAIALVSCAGDAVAQPHPELPAADSAFSAGSHQLAARLYQQILVREPRNMSVLVKAGYSALALNDLKTARSHFEVVVAAAPASGAPLAHGGLALTLARLGDREGALARLESAVAAGYAQQDMVDREKAFESLRNDPRFVAARRRIDRNAFPCKADSTSRSFDFWVGEWTVYLTGTTRQVGSSRVEPVSGGCAILEHWTGTTSEVVPPSTGESLNFPDPATGEWRQVWMGSGRGQNNYEHGRYLDGAMRFTYSRTGPQGRVQTGRFTFFNLDKDRVRQFLESSTDGGATYQPVYDFTYIRK
jgi:hypothetical protein